MDLCSGKFLMEKLTDNGLVALDQSKQPSHASHLNGWIYDRDALVIFDHAATIGLEPTTILLLCPSCAKQALSWSISGRVEVRF